MDVRWLYHIRVRSENATWPFSAPSLAIDGFIHASYRDRVVESAALYFPRDADLEVLMIDPRKLSARVEVASTPRGEMPHICGPIEEAAVTRIVSLSSFSKGALPDFVTPMLHS